MMLARVMVLLGALTCWPGVCLGSKGYVSFPLGYRESTSKDVGRRRKLIEPSNATLPLFGSVHQTGYFYANVFLGTPAQEFAMITDTGSTMAYVPCIQCEDRCGLNHMNLPFDPAASSTAELVPCSSSQCSSSYHSCHETQCTYTISYAEQSSSSGIVVSDLLAMEEDAPGSRISFGCETLETGMIYSQEADGLFALGNSPSSIVHQLVASGAIDNVFGLCFGGMEGEGALLLGDAPLPIGLRLQYTPLQEDNPYPIWYWVRLQGILLGSQLLPVDEAGFSEGYGTVLDSGTTFSYLPTAAFNAFAAEVETQALASGLYRVAGPNPQFVDVCFGGAPKDYKDEDALSSIFPTLTLQFSEMEPLILPPINYLFVHTLKSGKYCLGVFANDGPGTLLGGLAFRNILVQYDLANRRVGFGQTQCREWGMNATTSERPQGAEFGQRR